MVFLFNVINNFLQKIVLNLHILILYPDENINCRYREKGKRKQRKKNIHNKEI